jgi:hypothetical protein
MSINSAVTIVSPFDDKHSLQFTSDTNGRFIEITTQNIEGKNNILRIDVEKYDFNELQLFLERLTESCEFLMNSIAEEDELCECAEEDDDDERWKNK